MQLLHSKYISIFLVFLGLGMTVHAQELGNTGINVGAKIGISKLLTETDFSESTLEFNNQSGFTFDIEISKYLNNHIEIGAEFDNSVLSGENDIPNFSANGWHAAFQTPITEPVEYHNKLSGFNFFFRYYFRPALEESKFNPFIRAGMGYINYTSEFKYKTSPNPDDEGIIFGKGVNGYGSLSTAVFKLGTGFKTSLSSQVYLLTNLDFNLANYDFLDVVHNYDTSGNRIALYGIYSQIKIGIFYNSVKAGGSSNKKSKGRNKNGGSSDNTYLPFFRR